MYQVTFRINLLHDRNNFQKDQEILNVAKTKSTFLGTGPNGGSPIAIGKHGDTFTLYGKRAMYMKRLVEQGLVPNVELNTEPTEEEPPVFDQLYIVNRYFPELSIVPFFDDIDHELSDGYAVGSVAFNGLTDEQKIQTAGYGLTRIASGDNAGLYRSIRYTHEDGDNNYDYMAIEKIDETTGELTTIGKIYDVSSSARFCYYSGNNKFYMTCGEEVFTMDFDGNVEFKKYIYDVAGFVEFNDGKLYVLVEGSTSLERIDPDTCDVIDEESISINASEEYNLDYFNHITLGDDGDLYGVITHTTYNEEINENISHKSMISLSLNEINQLDTSLLRELPLNALTIAVKSPNDFILHTGSGYTSQPYLRKSLYKFSDGGYTLFIGKERTLYSDYVHCLQNGIERKYQFLINDDDERYFLVKQTLDPSTGEIEKFESLPYTSLKPTNSYINIGQMGMYSDYGNVLGTDVGFPLPYTHTQDIEFSDTVDQDFNGTSDGEILDGEEYFGEGSTYFTNKYDKMFILSANNINIDRFYIGGKCYQDSSYTTVSGNFSVTISGNTWTVFTKQSYGSGIVSINHMIIVPGDGSGITQEVNELRGSDYHELKGLSGIDKLTYILFSTVTVEGDVLTSTLVSEEAMESIVIEFFNALGVDKSMSNLNSVLSNLNTNNSAISSEIPFGVNFSDSYYFGYNGTQDFGGRLIGGLDMVGVNPYSVAIGSDNELICIDDDNFFKIKENGEIYNIITKPDVPYETEWGVYTQDYYDDVSCLVKYNGSFYAFGGDKYTTINPENGELGEVYQENWTQISFVSEIENEDDLEVYEYYRPIEFNGKLHCFADTNNGTRYCIIDMETNIATMKNYAGSYSGYLSFVIGDVTNEREMGRLSDYFNGFLGYHYDYDGAFIINYSSSIFPEEPTVDSIVMEYFVPNEETWTEDKEARDRYKFLDATDDQWHPLTISSIDIDGGRVYFYTTGVEGELTSSLQERLTTRMRYSNGNSSAYHYSLYD